MSEAVNLQDEEQGLAIAEEAMAAEETSNVEDLGQYIAKEYSDHKNTEGFRHEILSMVSSKKYRAVLVEIEAFYKEKERTMPNFKLKARRYFDYIQQLIEAIEEHKTIPNFDQLPAAQQKKVHEQVFVYFDELNNTLKRVEKVIHDLKVQDVRSTIWFIKTFSYCIMVLVATLAIVEAIDFLGNPFPSLFKNLENTFFSR